MFKGVVFDMDGILVDTEGFQWQGWIEVLKPYGLGMSKDDYISRYAGNTGTFIEEELIKMHNLDVDKGTLLEPKEDIMLNFVKNKEIQLMFYAREAVETLAAKGFRLGLVSGGPRPEVDIKLEKTGLKGSFEITVSRNDVERCKPHPDSYLLGAERLNIEPSQLVAIEDTSFGVASAKSAGLSCIAIPNEYSIKQDFSNADHVCKNLEEATAWIVGN